MPIYFLRKLLLKYIFFKFIDFRGVRCYYLKKTEVNIKIINKLRIKFFTGIKSNFSSSARNHITILSDLGGHQFLEEHRTIFQDRLTLIANGAAGYGNSIIHLSDLALKIKCRGFRIPWLCGFCSGYLIIIFINNDASETNRGVY